MADRYPTPDRRDGGARPARLSDARGRAALEQAIERTQNRRALEKALEETAHRRGSKGVSRIPRLSPRDAARAAKILRNRHPVNLALKMLAMVQEETRESAAGSYQHVPGHSLGGTCPITDPLDFSDVRTGLPSTTCQTGQAVGPGYGVNCFLGTGIWAKRLFAFNYNQLSWWIPNGNCQAVVDALPPEQRVGGFKTGLTSEKPAAHPSIDPLTAMPPGASMPAPVPWTLEAANEYGTDWSSAPTERREVGTAADPVWEKPERRPEPGTKERKWVVPSWVLRAVSAATEVLDAEKSIVKCLPKDLVRQARAEHYRKVGKDGPKWSKRQELELLYDNLDQVDARCAIFNILWDNFVEDRAYAFVGKHSRNPFTRERPGGGRALQLSRQGDAELPHGRLPLDVVEDWLKGYLGLKGR